MPYGLKYQTQFDSVSDANNPTRRYTLQFLWKDYTGPISTLEGGSVSVIQKRTEDNPKSPVQGQSLDIRLINNGNTPISSFQSDDDDGVQVILTDDTSVVRFTGFLVQDDFYEPKVDCSREITLSANDSLGLLKGVILSDARVKRRFGATVRTNGPLDEILLSISDTAFYANAGDEIEVEGVTYAITSVEDGPGVISGIINYNYLIHVTPSAAGAIPETGTVVYLTGRLNLLKKNSRLAIIGACLTSTNLRLLLNIYYNLFEYTQDSTRSTFELTLLDTQVFISGETYMNCYDVLSAVLKVCNCSIFQANGQWNIVHWEEGRRHASNAIPGFIYDESLVLIGNTVFSNNFAIGPEPQLTQPIAGLTEGALRGYKFTRRQFDYKNPKYLFYNYDLQLLGSLRSTYVSGGFTYFEYNAPGFTRSFGGTASERFIRVVQDSVGTEVDRYLVVRGPNFDSTKSVGSDQIQISMGDKIKFSCSVRTNFSLPGPGTLVFAVEMTDGTNFRYVDEVPAGNGNWISTVGFNYTFGGGDNLISQHAVEIQSSQTPFQGLLTLWLPQAGVIASGRETHYKDLRLEVTQFINDSSKVIGHIHKQERPTGPKLFSDEVIPIDDSPRNTIAGTIFTDTVNNLLQDRSLFWRYPTDITGYKLGELATLEEITWRGKTRSKLEGGFSGNWQNGIPISLLTMVQTSFAPTKNYIFGLLSIDYKNNSFSGTLWELFDTNDAPFDPDHYKDFYTFTYIYSTT